MKNRIITDISNYIFVADEPVFGSGEINHSGSIENNQF